MTKTTNLYMQQTFLQEVAEKLYKLYGNSISQLTIVLPSRRAQLFFSEALTHIVKGGVIWQPDYVSIDELMCEASSYKMGDKIRIICELHKIYSAYHKEPLDKFYFWGEMLLSDFDLVDKYMVDADMLFCNLHDLKEIEAHFTDTETWEVIRRFWQHFAEGETLPEHKEKFLSIWKSLGPVYHSLRERLGELNFAYQGMVYRSAAENLENDIVRFKRDRHYVFVGLNALSRCEQSVLKSIQKRFECDFYWDYDSYYTNDEQQEAGRFIRQNMSLFPTSEELQHNHFSEPKQMSAISTSSNVIQCKYVNKILRQISPELLFDKETAIVLTDENLLMPLLHSLPDDKDEKGENKLQLNITMGHPIKHTTAYSLILRLLELQHNASTSDDKATFYHVDVLGILNHPYITEQVGEEAKKIQKEIIKARYIRVSDELFQENTLLGTIFRKCGDWESLYNYLIDVIYAISLPLEQNADNRSLKLSYLAMIAECIKQITNSLKECDTEVNTSIYTSLLKRYLQTLRIPYSGEPLQGLQIMGILETRNLDFKNVIILSMTDDNFPGSMVGGASFIPYNLRAAYSLPTPEHHEGVYAYYFYRLIQRAERVDMIYCSLADDKSTGERSRYIHQLEFESPHEIKYYNVGVDVKASDNSPIVIEKTGKVREIMEQMLNNKEQILSPSSLTPYTVCPLKYYFSHVANIKTKDSISEDVDSPMFGNILHKAMETIYKPIKDIVNPRHELEQILKGTSIEKAVREAIHSEYFKNHDASDQDYTGDLLLVKNLVIDYIRKSIIPYDIKNNNFAVLHLEHRFKYEVELSNGSTVCFGGTADRIDSLDDGSMRVVDYKSGKGHNKLGTFDQVFHPTESSNYPLQLMIYSMILHHTNSERNIIPALYAVRNMRQDKFNPYLLDKENKCEIDYATYAQPFETGLRALLDEMFDWDTPFVQCEYKERGVCKFCEFNVLCKRDKEEE